MRRLANMVALALVAVLVLAPGATAQQMNGKHMMPDGTMMDNSQMMGGNTMASPSASASATPKASASSSASATPEATATAPQSHHHHSGGPSSASAAVYGRLPDTGGASMVSLVSVVALVLLGGFGLAATRLLRRST
jgi:LPXTG-motif cell wall-anchored protein